MDDILSEGELNHIIHSLRTSPLEWVGNEEWSKQMSMVEQLNVQAAYEASQGGEERVRDAFVEADKMTYLVHELILLDLWRTQVLPELLRLGKPQTSFQVYMVIFNEANVANILDTILFARSACEALEDSAIDLLDYAIRTLSQLCGGEIQVPKSDDFKETLSNWKPGQDFPQLPDESIEEEIQRLEQEILFQIAMKCISILRYITDHLEHMTLGVTTRLTITQDVPMLLVQLLKSKPWLRRESQQVFEGSDWAAEDVNGRMAKLEAQSWMALYNLLSKKSCADKYELNHYRQNVLIGLAGHINGLMINQLPILEPLKEWLLKLQVSQSSGTPVSQNLILIESVAEIEKSLRSRYDDKYQSIAQQQKDLFLGETSDTWQKEANKLLETLGSKAAHSLLPATGSSGNLPISCAHCQNAQPQHRCSRCKRVRYCNRQCQTADWQAGHRLTCLSSSSSS